MVLNSGENPVSTTKTNNSVLQIFRQPFLNSLGDENELEKNSQYFLLHKLKSKIIYVSNHSHDLSKMEHLAAIPCTKGRINVLKHYSTKFGLKTRMDYKDLLSFQHPAPFNNTILHGREVSQCS